MVESGRELRCDRRHSFAIAKQGYVSLLSGHAPTSGDDAEMVTARQRFLDTGAYAPLAGTLADAAAEALAGSAAQAQDTSAGSPVILDAGCGTGYYSAQLLRHLAGCAGDGSAQVRALAFDSATRAVRIAARAHPQITAFSWDVYRPLPVCDGTVDVLLDVFSPRVPAEFHRVLAPGGSLLIARPAQDHLAELRAGVSDMISIDERKEDRLAGQLAGFFAEQATVHVHAQVPLTGQQARDLVAMTPSGRHVDQAALAQAATPEEVSLSVLVSRFRRLD